MKIIKNILPFIIALLPQIVFENYTYIVVSTIAIGFIGGLFVKYKKVFLKIVILQFVFFSLLFYLTNDNIFYLNNVVQNLGLPLLLTPVIFILFNTLNISILFSFGYWLQKLVFSNFS